MASTLVADRSTASAEQTRSSRFVKLPDFLADLGGIPLNRIVMNPSPGTATVQDCLEYGERIAPAELIDGTIVEKAVGYREGELTVKLLVDLGIHIRSSGAGGILNGLDAQMRVEGGNVRLPDITYVTSERAPTRDEPVPELSPDLIVEVLSESNTTREIDRKLREFFDGGTRLAWVIDRRKQLVTIYRGGMEQVETLGIADSLDGEDVLPGFTIPVAKLFEGIPTSD
jgi:Uma2 family endonuclease